MGYYTDVNQLYADKFKKENNERKENKETKEIPPPVSTPNFA